jgi:hypothetical protein
MLDAIHIIDYLIKELYQIQLGLFNKVNYRTTPTRCKASEIVYGQTTASKDVGCNKMINK